MALSERAQNISESMTFAIIAKANELREKGEKVIDFGAGEPDFETPEYICDAAKEALDKGFTKYTSTSGYNELKEAIVEKLKNENNLKYDKDQIIVSNGAKHSIYNSFQALLNPGDEVIVPSPYWVSYPESIKMAGGKPVLIQTQEKDDFKINIDKMKEAITSNTKALMLNSPSNPTGSVYTKEELEKLAEVVVENDIYVVSDEIYEKIIYGDQKHVSIASFGKEIKDLTIVINGVSKAYSMTGWRIGYAAATKKIVKIMTNVQSHSTSNPNSIAQYASNVGIRGDHSFMEERKNRFLKRRDYMYDKINSIPNVSCLKPKGAFYILMNIENLIGKKHKNEKIKDSFSFSEKLIEHKKVTTVPGIAFGVDNFVRLSYANSLENIKKGLNRLEEFINETK